VFDHFRIELNALLVRSRHRLDPRCRRKLRELAGLRGLKVNIGCGPFGQEGWTNFDLFPHESVTLPADCRFRIPLGDESCIGIHVEHFFEHLSPDDERVSFLRECRRCLAQDGILRVIVPDAEKYVRAYTERGWAAMNGLSAAGDVPERLFRTKMEALNHVFLQGGEHYGGYDARTLSLVLSRAGFRAIHVAWRTGQFPGGCIDREHHRPYSLYFEALKL
jgi:predicted SAM-dependent methyltransferase